MFFLLVIFLVMYQYEAPPEINHQSTSGPVMYFSTYPCFYLSAKYREL